MSFFFFRLRTTAYSFFSRFSVSFLNENRFHHNLLSRHIVRTDMKAIHCTVDAFFGSVRDTPKDLLCYKKTSWKTRCLKKKERKKKTSIFWNRVLNARNFAQARRRLIAVVVCAARDLPAHRWRSRSKGLAILIERTEIIQILIFFINYKFTQGRRKLFRFFCQKTRL